MGWRRGKKGGTGLGGLGGKKGGMGLEGLGEGGRREGWD